MQKKVHKIIAFLLCGILAITTMLTTMSAQSIDASDDRLSKFDFSTYMYPIWGSGYAFQETCVFYEDAKGNITDASLLYTPSNVICVRNFGLNIVYEEGKDYTITGNVIHRTENSSIPYMPRTAYCKASDTSTSPQLLDDPNGGYLISDNTVMSKYYISISYAHSGNYAGKIPSNELNCLPTIKTKLENKQPVTIAILGDSISAGYSTSGLNDPSYNTKGQAITIKVNCAPYMPTWPVLLQGMLKKVYGYSDIKVVNCAIGGTNTNSACLSDMITRVVESSPDLVVIGFGMNEYWAPANQHGDRIEGVCNTIHTSCPNAEFILLSSMVPNKIARDESTFHFAAFETEYYDIQKNRTDLHIAVAPLNTVYSYIRTIKNDFDLVGGNNNHPNDYTVRMYAQTIAAVLGLYDTPYILTSNLAEGTVNSNYTSSIDSYCCANTTFTAVGLPQGLAMDTNGIISGIPTSAGEYDVTITATAEQNVSTVSYKLIIHEEILETENNTTNDTEKQIDSGNTNKSGCNSTMLSSLSTLVISIYSSLCILLKKKKSI